MRTLGQMIASILPRRRPRIAAPDILASANALLDIAQEEGVEMDLIRLQRLLLLSQGWSLALHGVPLHSATPKVYWEVPSYDEIHSAFRKYGAGTITGRACFRELPDFEYPADKDENNRKVLRSVVTAYRNLPAWNQGQALKQMLGSRAVGSSTDNESIRRSFLESIPA